MVSSGKTTRSTPAAAAASYASNMRLALPSRSPTTVFNCAAATRTRGMVGVYWAHSPAPAVSRVRPCDTRVMAVAVTDASAVRRAIERSADARAARAAVDRLVESQPDRAEQLAAGGTFLDAFVAIAVASHSLLAALIHDRDAAAVIGDHHALHARASDGFYPALLQRAP